MGGEIVRTPNVASIDSIIEDVHNAESAKDAAAWMDNLKKLLEVAEEYNRYACEYCTKEAYLYVRIAQIDGADVLLPRKRKNLVAWIRSKSDEEVHEILEECATGILIDKIRRRENTEMADIKRKERAINEFKRISGAIIEEYRKTGRTSCSPSVFLNKWLVKGKPDRETSKAYTEMTRDRILKMGGVGIADDMGTYVDPTTNNRDEIRAAISARLKSIYTDMRAIIRICKMSGYGIPERGLRLLRDTLDEMEYSDAAHPQGGIT